MTVFELKVFDANGVQKASGVNSISFAATPTGVFDASAVNTAGAYALTLSMDNQSANTVLAGPTGGGAATPAFRALVAADVPNISGASITSGVVATEFGGTGQDFSASSGLVKLVAGTASTVTAPSGAVVGDTDSQTLTNKTIGVSQLSGQVAIANGGTALSSTPTNGQLLIGNGTNYTLAVPTGSNGISITGGAGTLAIGTDASWHTLVANTIIGSDATFDLTSISGSYDHLVLVCQVRSDRAGTNNDNVYVRFNADSTAANYYGSFATLATAFAATERLGVTATGFELKGAASAATSAAGYRPGWMLWIYNYAVTAISKHVSLTGGGSLGDGTGLLTGYSGGGVWKNTSAAVSRITVLPVNGTNFTTGSSYALFGIK